MSINREELLGDFQTRLEKFSESNRAEIESALPESSRRNGAHFRRPQPVEDDATPNGATALIQQASDESLGESDRLVGELTKMRNKLQIERDRLMREIADFTALNQSAMTTMKTMAENLTHYRGAKPDVRRA